MLVITNRKLKKFLDNTLPRSLRKVLHVVLGVDPDSDLFGKREKFIRWAIDHYHTIVNYLVLRPDILVLDNMRRSCYSDADITMLHAVMTVIVDYYEIETECGKNTWREDTTSERELYAIYCWWKYEYPKLSAESHARGTGAPLVEIETKMLHRAVAIRGDLWI